MDAEVSVRMDWEVIGAARVAEYWSVMVLINLLPARPEQLGKR